MEILNSVPAVVRVLLAFVLILFAIRKKVPLGSAFLLGAIVLGLAFGLDITTMSRSFLHSLTHPKTLSLSVIVSLILVLSHSMESAGQMRRLLESFQGIISRPKINLVIFPALIGLLPMPGGAIFSAPMVKDLGQCSKLSSAQMSYVNYWFRHIWEYWWPLYPGVLLTTTLAGLDLWLFVLFLCPLTTVALLIGYWPLKTLSNQGSEEESCLLPRPPLGPFVKETAPILIVVLMGLGLGSLLTMAFGSHGSTILKEMGLVIALLVAIQWVWHCNQVSLAERWRIVSQKQLLRMIYMVSAILIFKGVLEDSHAVEAISQELLSHHIPLMPVTVILPFFVGGVVGLTIGFVGTTFPILISLIQSYGEGHFMLPYMMLALASGFVGVLLSPLHLCLLLSNEYFGTPPGPVYRYLWLPCVVLLSAGCIYFFVLHRFA